MTTIAEPPVASPLPEIEPASLQFIEREFPELFRDRHDMTRIREIHRALFVESQPLAAVRQQFLRSQPTLRVVAVTSGKGGVGKTTVSVNLAAALASRGQRVLLFDADLGMANIHIFTGVTPRGTLLDVVEGRSLLADVLTPGPAGVQIVCGASGMAGLADLDSRVIERLGRELTRLAADFDLLLIDTGAGISSQVMHFLALAHEIIVVATPNLAATLDAYGVIKVAREAKLGAEISIIVNQTDDDAEAGAIFARLSGCTHRFLGFLPTSLGSLRRDRAVETANQSRLPLVLAQPENENARRFTAMTARLLAHATEAAPARQSAAAA
ncbi:MAG: MinD/ParA family protein [Chthoniobacter sp.]|nr:MinD/ParA family protein [Chthoniobacter sp.]